MADTLTENPLIASFFSADPGGPGLTLEQLKARRAIAAALAAKSRDYPNTVGKGIFSAAESIGEGIRDYKLTQAERQMLARDAAKAKANADVFQASPDAAKVPPTGPPGPAAAPAPSTGASAELDSATDLSRAQMAEALMSGAQGSQTAGQPPLRMASLGSAATMSDAGQPGATYGGPSPAGPGASMAEPPDQSPPAPPAPPDMAADPGLAGPGPSGTPVPAPAAGGGVVPPDVAANRDALAQQVAQANQAFNPDAQGSLGAQVPPQMLAQVGGFGGGPAGGAAPAPVLPTGPGGGVPGQPTVQPARPGAPGVPVPPGGTRPDMSRFVPPTEAENTRLFGPTQAMPTAWVNPALREKYNRAMSISLDPYTGEGLRTQARDAAARIQAENDRLFKQAEDLATRKNTTRDQQIIENNKRMQEQDLKDRDPAEIEKRNAAIIDNQIQLRSGAPASETRKVMGEEQKAAEATAHRQQDFTMALDAINKGVFTGYGASTRLDLAKFAAWASQNEPLSQRAGSTELLKAKLLSTVGELVKDLKPVSGFETMMGKAQAGDIGMEKSTIETLLRQNLQRGYQQLSRYDQQAQSIFKGLGERDPNTGQTTLESKYKSPEATWFNNQHLPRFFAGATGPDAQQHMADFDQRYGPGAAAFVLQRKQLNPGAR